MVNEVFNVNEVFEVHSTSNAYSHPFEFHGFFDTVEEAREKGKSILNEKFEMMIGGKTGRFKYDEVQILDNRNPINRMINSCQMGRIANEVMKRSEDDRILIIADSEG